MTGSVGDVLGNEGVPLFVTWNGMKYPLSYPTLRVVDRIEKQIVRRSIDALEQVKSILTPAEYAEQKSEMNDLIRSRQHLTGGKLWANEITAGGGKRGLQYIVWACLAEGRDALPAAERAAVDEVPFDAVPTLLAESHDADAMVSLVSADFIEAVGKKLDLTADQVKGLQQMLKVG